MLTVVTGPPCAGKSTHIRDRAQPGDIIIDLDRIALALTTDGTPHHTYPPHVRTVALAARHAAIGRALSLAHTTGVWIIDTNPRPTSWAAYKAHGATIVKLDPGPAVIAARIKEQRPPEVMAVASAWYAKRAARRP